MISYMRIVISCARFKVGKPFIVTKDVIFFPWFDLFFFHLMLHVFNLFIGLSYIVATNTWSFKSFGICNIINKSILFSFINFDMFFWVCLWPIWNHVIMYCCRFFSFVNVFQKGSSSCKIFR